MRKLFLFFTALTLSAGLWAETKTVSYLYPVYNTPNDPKSGIKEWKTGSAEATVVENATEQVTWGTEGQESWYVVTSLEVDVQLTKGAVCRGDVHLILYSSTLRASVENNENGGAGIEVSGSNSLTIYGSANLNAVGGRNAAGIGGGDNGNGSNITINGGKVTAYGGYNAACIGGGYQGNGSNIIINGGQVTAYGGYNAACIGGGKDGQSSNIFVASSVLLMAGSTSNDAIETPHFTGYDMATILKDKQYVMLEEGKATAYVEGYNAGKAEGDAAGYARGKNDGINEGKAALPTDPEGTAGHTVTITKGEKTLILVNPDKVTYGKQE